MRYHILCLPILALLLAVPSPAQSGSISNQYNSLTDAERRLALRYFWQLPSVYGATRYANAESSSRYPQLVGQDDQRDAYRHSLWNGSMTRRLRSQRSAERWGTAHEQIPNNPAARMAMDLSNNQTGRATVWSMRTRNGPWWRRTRFPSDDQIATRLRAEIAGGGLVMIEEVGGQRDPQGGALVPTTTP